MPPRTPSTADLVAAATRLQENAGMLRLCLPARFASEDVQLLASNALHPVGDFLDALTEEELPFSLALTKLERAFPPLRDWMHERGANQNDLQIIHLLKHFQREKAPIYTLQKSLVDNLDDMRINRDVPVEVLRTPFPTCYLEFGEPEARGSLPFTINGRVGTTPAYLEGALIRATDEMAPSIVMSPTAMQGLHIDPEEPVRILEIAFSGSPLGLGDKVTPVSNLCDVITLFIQDETEGLTALLDRHARYYAERFQGEDIFGRPIKDIDEAWFNRLRDNTYLLTKALLYITQEHRHGKRELTRSELEARLKRVAPKKQRRLIAQRDRSYDRIVIGGELATPKERWAPQGATGLHVKPHWRAGYFGVRWMGSGENKRPVLRWVRTCWVGPKDTPTEERPRPKDYIVKPPRPR